MRSSSASKSSPPRPAMTTSPSSDAALGQGGAQRVRQLREVAIERLQVAGLDVDLVAVAEDDRAEAVPLGLEQPAVAIGQPVGRLGQHRLDRRIERQVEGHRPSVPSRQGRPRGPPRARSRPRFQATGPCTPGPSTSSAPLVEQEPPEPARSGFRAAPAARRRRSGWRRRAARTDSRGRGRPGRRAGRGSGSMTPVHVALRDERGGARTLSPTRATDPDDGHPMAQPARPVASTRSAAAPRAPRQRGDRHDDVQAQLGPAVGVLVEPQAHRRGRQHDDREPDQHEPQRRGTAGRRSDESSPARRPRRPPGRPRRRARRSRAARSRCTSSRRRPACRGRRTGRPAGGPRTPRRRGRRRAGRRAPRRRRGRAAGRSAACWRPLRATRAPWRGCQPPRRSACRPTNQATREDEQDAPGQVAEVDAEARGASSKPRRKIGSADANRTANMTTSGIADQRGRARRAQPAGSRRGPRPSARARRAAAARTTPAQHGLRRPRRRGRSRPRRTAA